MGGVFSKKSRNPELDCFVHRHRLRVSTKARTFVFGIICAKNRDRYWYFPIRNHYIIAAAETSHFLSSAFICFCSLLAIPSRNTLYEREIHVTREKRMQSTPGDMHARASWVDAVSCDGVEGPRRTNRFPQPDKLDNRILLSTHQLALVQPQAPLG